MRCLVRAIWQNTLMYEDNSGMEDIIKRNNVIELGNPHGRPLLLAHGFGCDQNMWRFLVPLLLDTYRLFLFDYVGAGKSTIESFSVDRYSTLEGYAEDMIEVIEALKLSNMAIVGHSVSGTIAQLVALKKPELVGELIMVCPSPCFINDLPEYEGGFEREDLEELIDLLETNYIGWANYLAPIAMGLPIDNDMTAELATSFCSSDPVITSTFARATFFGDYRYLLPKIDNKVLILQSAKDSLAQMGVGQYMHLRLKHSKMDVIDSEGHCLHMTDPATINKSIRQFLQ